MSGLRSALDELFGVDDSGLSAAELAADLVELAHVGQMVEVLQARKIRSLADRGGHCELGYSSPTALLVDQTRVSPGHAKRIISYGKATARAAHAHRAWSDGRLSTDQATHLFRAAEAVPDQWRQATKGPRRDRRRDPTDPPRPVPILDRRRNVPNRRMAHHHHRTSPRRAETSQHAREDSNPGA